jgi:hypothetical protein
VTAINDELPRVAAHKAGNLSYGGRLIAGKGGNDSRQIVLNITHYWASGWA